VEREVEEDVVDQEDEGDSEAVAEVVVEVSKRF
jgi:hypothetical protein